MDFGSAVGGLFGVYNGLLNYYSQADTNRKNKQNIDDTNRTNLEIAEKTNQANLELYREQYSDAVSQWMRENEYNTPENQVQRLRQAGLNPSLVMGGPGEVGTAGSMSMPSAASISSGAPMQAAHMQAPMVDFSDVANNVAALSAAEKSSSEARAQNINNQFLREQNKRDIQLKIVQTKVLLSNKDLNESQRNYLEDQISYLELQLRMFNDTYDEQKQSFKLSNDLTIANTQLIRQNIVESSSRTALNQSVIALNKKEDYWFNQRMAATIAKIYNDISVGKTSINLYNAYMLVEAAKEQGLQLSNQQAKEIMPYIIENAKELVEETKTRSGLNRSLSGESQSRKTLNEQESGRSGFKSWNEFKDGIYDFLPKFGDPTSGIFPFVPRKR